VTRSFLPRGTEHHRLGGGLWALIPAAAIFAAALYVLPTIVRGTSHYITLAWFPTLGVDLSLWIDGLSLLFVLLIAGMGLLIIWYTRYYLAPGEALTRFLIYLLLFMGAMLGMVLSANLLVLLVFWELTSITSYLLIGFWHTRPDAIYAARKALLITVSGGLALLGGVVLLYQVAGTAELPELAARAGVIRDSPQYPIILALVLIGAGAKSAQFPFHVWLPSAMAAPTPVSAYLHSATMVKAGLFLICRMTPVLGGTAAWLYAVASLGLITMLTGAVLALRQHDLKALLAYSTISQLGLILVFYAPASAASVHAGLFHLVNHAAFKGALFLLVGIIEHATGTRDRRELRGLLPRLPATAVLLAVAALALAGVPPLNGFLSKEMLFDAALEETSWGAGRWLVPGLIVLGSALTVAYALLASLGTLLGKQEPAIPTSFHKPAIGMLLAPALLVLLCVFIGLDPAVVDRLMVAPAVHSVTDATAISLPAFSLSLTPVMAMSLMALAGGTGLYLAVRASAGWAAAKPSSLSLDALYDWSLIALDRVGLCLTGIFQSGYLKIYVMMTLGYLALSFGYPFIFKAGASVGTLDLAAIEPFEALLIYLLMFGALAVPFAGQPLIAVLTLGAVGLLVSFLFVLFQAPDLALTQLLIETASLILFLLVLRHLPPFGREIMSRWVQLRDIFISTAVAGLVVVLLLIANGETLYPSIASYFLEHSLSLGGGRNAVNVIVVDFRGYDTMGEITVLSLAAVGVYALVKLRRDR
jgi:multicomponent Na+:H+ antiporter subunit A